MESVAFEDLKTTDLVVDCLYEGGTSGNAGDDPINRLARVGNSGGFRFVGSADRPRLLVLYTSGAEADWPDRLDLSDGSFIYYGDNRRPGRDLHDTSKGGNRLLREMFSSALSLAGRSMVPPILLFEKAGRGRDVLFRGLLVPGSPVVPVDEQLVAIWRSAKNERFQNYRAVFSVLDARSISRAWIDSVLAGDPVESGAPQEWIAWRETGLPKRLLAPRSLTYRTREQQLPTSREDVAILNAIHSHFDDPYEFENFAAQVWMMMAPATDELEVTRRSRDGGRDAVGRYRIGPPGDPIRIEFALEAKCYAPHRSVGVKEVSRLISRLRHRQFGVLVTTSFVAAQAYEEVRDDQHPVAIVSGSDIVTLLKERGKATVGSVKAWLDEDFPPGRGTFDAKFTAAEIAVEFPKSSRAQGAAE